MVLKKKRKAYWQSKTVQFISYKNYAEHIDKTTTNHIMETLKLVTNPKWSLESMKNNGSTLISTRSNEKWKQLNQKCQIRTYYNGTVQLKKSKIKLPCLQNANPKPGPSVASLSLSLSLSLSINQRLFVERLNWILEI